jgi:transposase-like protein
MLGHPDDLAGDMLRLRVPGYVIAGFEWVCRGVASLARRCADGGAAFRSTRCFQALLQTRIVHLIGYSMQFASWKEHKAIAAALKPIYGVESAAAAAARFLP